MTRAFRLDTPHGYIATKNISEPNLAPKRDIFSQNYGTPGAPKRARFGPEWPFWGPRRSSDGPGGPDLVPTAPNWSAWAGLMLTTHFDLVSGPFWVPGGPKRARFGPKCPLALNFHGPILCGVQFCVRFGKLPTNSIPVDHIIQCHPCCK